MSSAWEAADVVDESSLATPASLLRCSSLHLDMTPNFDTSVIQATARLRMRWTDKAMGRGADTRATIALDTRELVVSGVKSGPVGSLSDSTFHVAEQVGDLGSPLVLSVAAETEEFEVEVLYETSPTASGLQWLPKEQTDGKRHPYLFTQFQAIHARSAIPCQDSPSVKFTYTADVTAPAGLVARMSALETGSATAQNGTTYSFEQKVPMTSYLVAFVVGDIVSAPIGPRSSVWTEKENLEKCVYEFAETEQFITAAEDILTPYVWGRYDLLVLPSSFPYGGMENPCLTFVTPTLLAGDRSQADVVAHEIAHSWCGNLVTNVNWESFWLNEGFTVFVERKIAARVASSDPERAKQIRGFKHTGGWKDLQHDVQVVFFPLLFSGGNPLMALTSVRKAVHANWREGLHAADSQDWETGP
jgi:leukotriene-A4 hydrolase